MTSLLPPLRGPVAAVIIDAAEAAVVARWAARIAAEQQRPVLLLVPVLSPAFTTDPVIAWRIQERGREEADAIAARARPALEAAGAAVRVQVVWHRGRSWRRDRPAGGTALFRAARKAGADVVFTPAAVPMPAAARGPQVLFVAPSGAPPIPRCRPQHPGGSADP